MLAAGSRAPEFFLPDQMGTTRSLKGALGRWVVLWWYPRASSRTCTLQGHAFQSLSREFALSGAAIYGACFNSVAENKSFAEDEQFDFPLLADESMKVGQAYGVTREPDDSAVNKPRRVTYLIDPDQVVRQVYLVEDAGLHPEQVLLDLRALQSQLSRPQG
jgi:thioredoxin-dependent peroxiredoxin